jgi:guanylate kinase
MSQGKLLVITGPSGVGKGTLVKSLLQRNPELYLSISTTTRLPRKGEINAKDYYFVDHRQFEKMIQQGDLLEWAEYASNYYGTPRLPVEKKINEGKVVILEIEVLGARQVKKSFPDALLIFIAPPSEQELERRLRGRQTDSEEVILRRLNKAKEELAASNEFDYKIVNDKLEIALQSMENIINS